MKLNYSTMVLAGLSLLWVLWHYRALPWTALRLTGVIVMLPSLLLLTLARVQLGSAFSVRPKAEILVTTGLYAKIRNPIYLFGSLTLAGLALMVGMPWLLLAFLVVGPMQIYRSRLEERVLAERFGSAYQSYKQKTWF